MLTISIYQHRKVAFIGLCLLAWAFSSAHVFAQDIELYRAKGAISPNLLFILDTSDSMHVPVANTGLSRLENMVDALEFIVKSLTDNNVGLMRFTGNRAPNVPDPYIGTGGSIIFPVTNLDDSLSVVEGENSSGIRRTISIINGPADDAIQLAGANPTIVDSSLLQIGIGGGRLIEQAIITSNGDAVQYSNAASIRNCIRTNGNLQLSKPPANNSNRTCSVRSVNLTGTALGVRFTGIELSSAQAATLQLTVARQATDNEFNGGTLSICAFTPRFNLGEPYTNNNRNKFLISTSSAQAADAKVRLSAGLLLTVNQPTATHCADEQGNTGPLVRLANNRFANEQVVNQVININVTSQLIDIIARSSGNVITAAEVIEFILAWDKTRLTPSTDPDEGLAFYSFDTEPSKAPKLIIERVALPAVPQSVGLRFDELNVPPKANIRSATLRFRAQDTGMGAVDTDGNGFTSSSYINSTGITISIQTATDHYGNNQFGPLPFADNADDAVRGNSRVWDPASVNWTPPISSAVNAENQLLDANVTSLVQKVVNLNGFCEGSAIAFKLDRASTSAANNTIAVKSYESRNLTSDAYPPITLPTELVVEYDTNNISPGTNICRIKRSHLAHARDNGVIDSITNQSLRPGLAMDLGTTTAMGLRFPNTLIHPNVAVDAARLVFKVADPLPQVAGTITANIQGDKTRSMERMSPSGISNSVLAVSLIQNVTGNGSLTIPVRTDMKTGERIYADVTSIVKEIISVNPNQKNLDEDWEYGNSMGFYLDNLNINPTALRTNSLHLQGYNTSFEGLNNNRVGRPLYLEVRVQEPFANEQTKTVRQRILELIANMDTTNRTPSVESLFEAALYWSGEPVFFGGQRGRLNKGMSIARTSHPGTHDGTQDLTCIDSNSARCATDILRPSSGRANVTYQSPINNECHLNSYQIFLSDGLPTENATIGNSPTGQSTSRLDHIANNGYSNLAQTLTGNCANSGGASFARCADSITRHLYTTDLNGSLTNQQKVTTYGVGFNLCTGSTVPARDNNGKDVCCEVANLTNGLCSSPIIPNSVGFMQDLSTEGGGQFVLASSASQLVNALTEILDTITLTQQSFVAPTVSANAFNRLETRDRVYFGLFLPAVTPHWQGNLKKYGLCVAPTRQNNCSLGEIIDRNDVSATIQDRTSADFGQFTMNTHSYWSAGVDGRAVLSGGAQSRVPVWNDNDNIIYTDVSNSGQATNGSSLDAPGFKLDSSNYNNATMQAARNAICTFTQSTIGNTICDNLMLWVLGKDVNDEDGDFNTNEDRYRFADILHSSPVTVTYGRVGTTLNSPIIDKVLVGTNEGLLYFINGESGVTEWSFMPNALMGLQAELYVDGGTEHLYGIDSTPIVDISDVNNDGIINPATDSARVYFSQRRGGNNIWGLDITPPSILTTNSQTTVVPRFLWKITGGSGDFARLGQTWSEPIIANIRTVDANNAAQRSKVLIFGGGYDTDLDKLDASGERNFREEAGDPNIGNAIYVVDVNTGNLVFSISSDSGSDIVVADMKYAIPSNLTVLDSDTDGFDDRIYVGDVGGQIWRVDLGQDVKITGNNREGSTIVGKLADLSTTSNITNERRFFYAPSIVQVQDTQYSNATSGAFDYVVLGSGNRANPLNTSVQDRIYGIRDRHIQPLVDSQPDNLADNYPLRINGSAIGNSIRNSSLVDITTNSLDPSLATTKDALGWYFNLNDTTTPGGEKVLSSVRVIRNIAITTTFTPGTSLGCESISAGMASVYNFNILSAEAALDWDGDGQLGNSDRVQSLGTGIPSAAIPVFTTEGVTLMVGSSGGATNLGKVSDLPKFNTYWYEETNPGY